MAFQPFTFDVNIHTRLPDSPRTEGYNADQLKALFDSPMVEFKKYINEVMIPALESFTPESSVGVYIGEERPGYSPVLWWKPASGGYSVTYIDAGGVLHELPAPYAVVQDDSVSTAKLKNGAVTAEKIDPLLIEEVGTKPLKFTNVSVSRTAFQPVTGYGDFKYRAFVPLSGVTADMFPISAFSFADVFSCFLVDSYAGGVYLYSDSAPENNIVIPSIVLVRW